MLKSLRLLEAKREKLFVKLGEGSHSVLEKKPKKDKWSVLQILYHMMLAEEGSLKYVKKKLSYQPNLKSENILTKLRTKLLIWGLKSPFKFRAPAGFDEKSFPSMIRLEDLDSRWMQGRMDHLKFIREMDDYLLDMEIYKHPIAGRITVEGMLKFYHAHFDRHQQQIFKAMVKRFPQ